MKPIEAGCLAIINEPNTVNNGMCVTVGCYIGVYEHKDGNFAHGDDAWEVDKPQAIYDYHLTKIEEYAYVASESNLIRIDGYKETESEKLEAEA